MTPDWTSVVVLLIVIKGGFRKPFRECPMLIISKRTKIEVCQGTRHHRWSGNSTYRPKRHKDPKRGPPDVVVDDYRKLCACAIDDVAREETLCLPRVVCATIIFHLWGWSIISNGCGVCLWWWWCRTTATATTRIESCSEDVIGLHDNN